MRFPQLPIPGRLILSGEVLFVRLVVESTSDSSNDEWLWATAQKEGYRLREEMNAAIHEHLGPEFDVRSMSLARGSLEILVVIGTLYYAVSRYKNFIESVELAVAQLKRVVGSFFERRGPVQLPVRATWNPGPGLVLSSRSFAMGLDGGVSGLVVCYLVLSHAAMLAMLMWLLISRGP